MRFQIFACLVFLSVAAYAEDDCKTKKCPSVPKHYEEFGCTPVTEPGKCCPTHFNCDSLKARDTSKCHYNGKSFNVGEDYHNQEIESSCTIGCRCQKDGYSNPDITAFQCTHIDCPEFFGGPPAQPGKKCIRQYGAQSCCMEREVCGEDLNKLAKCEFEGKSYYEGERIDSGQSCYSCLCEKGFEDKPVEENKSCQKINCNMELHYYSKIMSGCIPVYYKTDDCCPISWRCPDEETKVVADSKRTVPEGDSGLKCSFGALKMNLGDFLSPEDDYDQCTICTCKLPPYAHCIKTC